MLSLTSLTILILAISPASAVIINNNNGRHSTTSRIIGAVVAVVIVLALLSLLCIARRRRARAGGPLLGGFAPGSTGAGKFGGGFNRWGAGNNNQNQNQSAYNQPNAGYFPGGPPAGAKYPPGEQAGPPPYTSTAKPGTFSAVRIYPSFTRGDPRTYPPRFTAGWTAPGPRCAAGDVCRSPWSAAAGPR
ncbi:hypothetical protein B0H16DRAFT_1625185 [Mycena metata]|uniref:Uncharacterized protein n=1 Tax=Mycena metata TaxID=1033252 RepID=A0AAD7MDK0_9AGAR|nr:hypothetical protein B0H16DRAFT_1625185 [Mycena metata]